MTFPSDHQPCPCGHCQPVVEEAAPLTGIEKEGLKDLVERYARLIQGEDDQPMFDVKVDATGCVTELPVFPWEDVVEMVARDCIGEVRADE